MWIPGFSIVQTGLILHEFSLHNFALTLFVDLHHFLNLCNNVQFIAIWHRRSMAALTFCGRLAESDVSVMPLVVYGLITLVI